MKRLDTQVFGYEKCPAWAKFAAVDEDGKAYWLERGEVDDDKWVPIDETNCRYIGPDYDATDWQHSRVDRPNEAKHVHVPMEALKKVTDAFEAVCVMQDDWCGSESCPRCGKRATIINEARATIAKATP